MADGRHFENHIPTSLRGNKIANINHRYNHQTTSVKMLKKRSKTFI